jgi:ribose transport system permease protein
MITDRTMQHGHDLSHAGAGRRLMTLVTGDYGMLLVLLGLCLFFSFVTMDEQAPAGGEAARQLAGQLAVRADTGRIVVVTGRGGDDTEFADGLRTRAEQAGWTVAAVSQGGPREARMALEALEAAGETVEAIVCSPSAASWAVFDSLGSRMPHFAETTILRPRASRWPNFLKAANLLNVANQIAVIAIVAIGMTLVILTGGIDLSVGSLIALSSVVAARLIRDVFGGQAAGLPGMVIGSLAGILVCGAAGLFSGAAVTLCGLPPFIATLGMMLVASGSAYMLADGQSINQVPDAFVWLGRGSDLLGIPNAVVLMLALYAVAHVAMSRTTFGRYVYAVGGNSEAARLSGVPVRRVVLAAYVICGLLAGLGGVVMASQLKSGAPTYGQMYELYVIAAVVVGGTSLSGGEGRVLGTLVGAFIIAVIQNGMNLLGIESYTQKVVLGLVILVAVLLDRLRLIRR